MKHNIVRVLGPKKRIYRGTERRDRIKLNDKELRGYVKVVRQSGEETVSTCFYNQKENRLEEVEGYNWPWLCKKNCRTVKVDNAPEPIFIYHAGDFTIEQILDMVKDGKLDVETGAKLLEAA